MLNFLHMTDEDLNFVFESIDELQIIFHPTIAPEGKINYKKLHEYQRKKPIILFWDRNILSSFLKLCQYGSLKSKGEAQIIGLLKVWATVNDVDISAGLAIKERASQTRSQVEGLLELQKFLDAFSAYPDQIWLYLACGRQFEIPPVNFSNKEAKNITVDYTDAGDHYDMALASLLYIVQLYRNKKMKAVDKLLDFFQWTYDHVLVGGYLWVYAALLFAEVENIKAPKHANSNDIAKIISGCENQAWDISYLSNWSTLYMNTEQYDQEFMFATNDVLLKRIFANYHGEYELNGLLHEIFPQKEYDRICDYLEENIRLRPIPKFGSNPKAYFQELIQKEKQKLADMLVQGG